MKDFFSIFQGVFNFFKSISKDMYKKCAIVSSGAAIIAIVTLTSNCYGGSGKNNVKTVYAESRNDIQEEADDLEEERMEETGLADSMSERTLDKQQTTDSVQAEISIENNIVGLRTSLPADAEKELISTDDGTAISSVRRMLYDDFANSLISVNTDMNINSEYVNADYIQPIISITDEDYDNLVRIVEAEATGLDIKAKILVANVIINRVFAENFPDTVTEVIFQQNGLQFQPVMDGRFYSVEVSDTSIEAVDRALLGEDYSEGALYFAATASAGDNSWFALKLKRLFEYNGHVFFTEWE